MANTSAPKINTITLHGRFYKAQPDPDGTYDGTRLTEKDCKAVVDQFYEEKSKTQKKFPVNYEHRQDKRDILGFIDDIYFNDNEKSLYSIFTIYPTQSSFAEVKNKLEAFEKKFLDNGQSINNLAIKDMVGLSIELSLGYSGINENGVIIDRDAFKVSSKKFNGFSVVEHPNYYDEDTFVTSFTEGELSDLLKKDITLKDYISSTNARKEISDKFISKHMDLDKDNSIQNIDNSKQVNSINEEKGNFFVLKFYIISDFVL